jgi:hypothetical protein
MNLDVAGTEQLADGTYLNESAVAFENERAASRMVGGFWVDLRMGNFRTLSQDETRYDFETDCSRGVEAAGLSVRRGGPRDFILSVMVGSDDQLDMAAPSHLSSMVRTRIRRSDVKSILAAADMALGRVMPTVNADYRDADGRMVSYAMTDLVINTIEEDHEIWPEGGGEGYIHRVIGEGKPEIEEITLDVTGPEHEARASRCMLS